MQDCIMLNDGLFLSFFYINSIKLPINGNISDNKGNITDMT